MKQRKFRQITLAFIKFHFFEGQNKVAKFRKMKYFECVNIYFNKQYQCFPEKLREIEFDEKIAKSEKKPFDSQKKS